MKSVLKIVFIDVSVSIYYQCFLINDISEKLSRNNSFTLFCLHFNMFDMLFIFYFTRIKLPFS